MHENSPLKTGELLILQKYTTITYLIISYFIYLFNIIQQNKHIIYLCIINQFTCVA